MTIIKDLCAITGSYQNKMGETKNQYTKVGVYMKHSDGKASIKLEKWFNPSGAINAKGDCWLGIYEQKQKDPQTNTNSNSQKDSSNLQSDVPF